MDELKPLKMAETADFPTIKEVRPKKPRQHPSSGRGSLIALLIVILVVVVIGLWYWLTTPSQSGVFHYVFGQRATLEGSDGRINILLLGISGGNHDGPNLTDTIMVVSYNTQTQHVDLFSLPRDIWIDQYRAKINAIYEIGLAKGEGLSLAEKETGNILGLTVPYAIRVDFDGFTRAIDLVGGLDINVSQSFNDYLYPIEGQENNLCGYQEKNVELSDEEAKSNNLVTGKYLVLLGPDGKIATSSAKGQSVIKYTDLQVSDYFSCRYEHISFTKGVNHLDGATTLKYVRSRHGTNGEGSDFARARRQQQVLQAFKEKVLSLPTLTDPPKIVDLLRTFGSSIETDIPTSSFLELIKLARSANKLSNWVIDASGNRPLLITPDTGDFGGAWVLVPASGDYSQIHLYVKSALNGLPMSSESAKIATPTPSPKP